jgi:hypothetical protein
LITKTLIIGDIPIIIPTAIPIPICLIEPPAEQPVFLRATLVLALPPSAAPVRPDLPRTTATTRSYALRLWRAKLSAALLVHFPTSGQSPRPMVNVQHMTLMFVTVSLTQAFESANLYFAERSNLFIYRGIQWPQNL